MTGFSTTLNSAHHPIFGNPPAKHFIMLGVLMPFKGEVPKLDNAANNFVTHWYFVIEFAGNNGVNWFKDVVGRTISVNSLSGDPQEKMKKFCGAFNSGLDSLVLPYGQQSKGLLEYHDSVEAEINPHDICPRAGYLLKHIRPGGAR